MKYIEGGVTAAKGFSAGGMYCGIRKNKSKPDLAMIYSSRPLCGGRHVHEQPGERRADPGDEAQPGKRHGARRDLQFRQREHLQRGRRGKSLEHVRDRRQGAAHRSARRDRGLHGRDRQVLPIEPIADTAPLLAASLSGDGSSQAARAIMTTDTVVKEAAAELEIGGKTVRLGGICKGSGMIHPNMCTMLCFLTTDARRLRPGAEQGAARRGGRHL